MPSDFYHRLYLRDIYNSLSNDFAKQLALAFASSPAANTDPELYDHTTMRSFSAIHLLLSTWFQPSKRN